MNRYERLLNSKTAVLGLMAIAGWLVVSESYLWWSKLATGSRQSGQQTTAVALQQGSESAANLKAANVGASDSLDSLIKWATLEQVTNVPKGNFKYGGSTTWAPLRKELDPAVAELFPEFELQYTSPDPQSGRSAGSGSGIRMLLDRELDFAQSSRPLKAEERAEARSKGYELRQLAIAVDGIAIAVNPNLDIPGLSVEQLKQIYTGKIKNWQELGGPDLKILSYARSTEDSGTAEFFTKAVLGKDTYASDVKFVESTTAGIRQVADNQGGIYYASAPEVVGQCMIRPLPIGIEQGEFVAPYQAPYVEASNCPRYRNRLNAIAFQSQQYPLTRNLFLIIKEDGDNEEPAGIAYANFMLTDEADSLIESAGFVSADSQ